MSEHARLSPSGSGRWMRCPASVNLTQGLHGESEAAAEGTRAHVVLERALKLWIATGEDIVPMDDCDNEEMQEHIQTMFDYVVGIYEDTPGDDKHILIETRVDLHYMTKRDDLWGKADIIIYSDHFIDCLDLKYGEGIFVPADSSQNRIYLLGAMSMLMKKSKGDIPWTSVRSIIMQPRYPDKDGNTIRIQEYDPQELIEWKDQVLLPAAIATDDPNAQPIAGKEQCQFCLAKSTCPAVAAKVNELCSVFEPVLEEQPDGTMLTIEPTDMLSVDRLIEVHDNIPFISGYLAAVSKRLRILLEARDPELAGKLKLVRSHKTNMWTLEGEELATQLMKGTGRILKADLYKSVVISAPQALKLKSLKPAQKAKLQKFIKKSEGSLSIVPDSDPRANAFPPVMFEDQTEVASEQPEEEFDFL